MSADKPFHNPFGALEKLRATRPEPVPEPETPVAQTPPAGIARGPARAVVRVERAGRGGKEVTVVDHLGLAAGDRQAWLKALKAALGCGGVVEGDRIVLQGDHRQRVPAILTSRGVRKVTIG